MDIIEARGIGKAYQATGAAALHPISMRIPKGEFVAIVGPSGSGKSTLLNIIGLLDRPTCGKLMIGGVDCSGLGCDEMALLRNRQIGFIFQSYHLLSRLTAIANVELPLVYAGVRKDARRERAERALDSVGILSKQGRLPTQLSGGEQQRVAVARAIVSQPAIVLADEPTGALDTRSGHEVIDILKRLNRAGHTIVMVTHDPGVAREASRTVSMRDGWIVDDGTGSARAVGAARAVEAVP